MKHSKPLWRISVTTAPEAEDAVSDLLASVCGLPAAAYFDWESQLSRVSVYAGQGTCSPAAWRREVAAGVARLKSFGVHTGAAKIQITRLKREDWAESWKRHFKPMVINRLLVKPSWSKQRAAKNQAVVVLDPGLSFGTGRHPTTAYCLHQLSRCLKPGKKQSFLDIGTGSGILAIAAAKLGYAPIQAFDWDPDCVRVARENARKNRVAGRLRLARGDIARLSLRPGRQFDLICANLISNLLIRQRWRIVRRLKQGGVLVLAGILAAEFAEVQQAYAECGLKLRSSRVEKEWRSGAFCFG
jgi:ribosomal protein L11 methyltransferase